MADVPDWIDVSLGNLLAWIQLALLWVVFYKYDHDKHIHKHDDDNAVLVVIFGLLVFAFSEGYMWEAANEFQCISGGETIDVLLETVELKRVVLRTPPCAVRLATRWVGTIPTIMRVWAAIGLLILVFAFNGGFMLEVAKEFRRGLVEYVTGGGKVHVLVVIALFFLRASAEDWRR